MIAKSKTTPIAIIAGIVLVSMVLWFTGAYDKIFSRGISTKVGNTLPLDLETLQHTIRTVSSPLIEELQFIEAIDTLTANESLKELRNPFVRVYVAPPPSEKPKETPKTKKKTTKKRKPRKKRIVRPKITINGIIWDRSNPYAILNNDIYGEGDIIRGYTVQTIHDTMIVLANKEDIFSIVIERE